MASTSRHSSRQTRLSTMQCSSSSSSSSKPHMHTGRKRASRQRLRLAPPPRPIHPTSQHNRRNRHSRRPTWRRNRKHRLQHTRHRPCSHRPCSRYSCRRVLRVLRLLAPRHRLRAGCAPALGHARHDARSPGLRGSGSLASLPARLCHLRQSLAFAWCRARAFDASSAQLLAGPAACIWSTAGAAAGDGASGLHIDASGLDSNSAPASSVPALAASSRCSASLYSPPPLFQRERKGRGEGGARRGSGPRRQQCIGTARATRASARGREGECSRARAHQLKMKSCPCHAVRAFVRVFSCEAAWRPLLPRDEGAYERGC